VSNHHDNATAHIGTACLLAMILIFIGCAVAGAMR